MNLVVTGWSRSSSGMRSTEWLKRHDIGLLRNSLQDLARLAVDEVEAEGTGALTEVT